MALASGLVAVGAGKAVAQSVPQYLILKTLPARAVPLPAQVPTGPNPNDLQVIKGGDVHETTGGHITFLGGVHLRYKGYDLYADKIEGNRILQVFDLVGHARLIGKDAHVEADQLIVDYPRSTYQAFDGTSDLSPAFVGGILTGDVYAKGAEISGTEKETFVMGGEATTCDYLHPHYSFNAAYTDVRVGKRIIFKHVDVMLLGKKVASLPYLSLPLDDRFYQNLPTVGEDNIEGYFLKTRYAIPTKQGDDILTRVDLMSRLGIGLGADYVYDKETGKNPHQGDFGFYGVTGSGTFDLNESDRTQFSWGTFQTQNSIQNHDYQTNPQGTLVSNQATLTIPNLGGSTSLALYRLSSSNLGFTSTQQNLSLSDTHTVDRTIRSAIRLTYSDNATIFGSSSASNIDNRQLNMNVDINDDLKKANAEFLYQRNVPIGTIQNFYNSTDVTPSLALTTDSSRLFGYKFGSLWPIQTSFSLGQYGDPNGGTVTRDQFKFAFNKTTDPRKKSQFTLGTGFNQSFYSDSTALYSMALNSSYRYRLGSDTAFNIRYNYLRPEGYTPLAIDSSGKVNQASSDLSFRIARHLLLGAQTGYDALQGQYGLSSWQPIGIRAEYRPTNRFDFRALSTYDTINRQWGLFQFDLSAAPKNSLITMSGTYDPQRHVWGQVNALLQALHYGRITADILASYDGYSKTFSSRQLSVNYDLHCAVAIFQVVNSNLGFNPGTTFAFYIQLKAVPFGTLFGSGTQGQAVGVGSGISF